jgi:hypothetical protein
MKLRPTVVLAVLATVSAAHAAVLVSFDMSTIAGTNSTKGFVASTVDAGVTATNLLKKNLTNASPVNTVTYGGNSAGTWTTGTAQAAINIDTTLTNANYITFSVTPIEGSSMTIESISFGAAASSNSTVRSIYLFSSATGFTASDLLLSDANALGGGTLALRAGGVLSSYSLTLTDPAFTGITGATEFRIYLQTGSANQDIDFDNITLNGTVSVIPEPSSFALLAAGLTLGLAVAGRRRR